MDVKLLKVSVVMGVYRPDRDLFPKAVASILAQTHEDFEFIIIDDGNTVDDRKFISQFCGDSRIRLIENKTNVGLTKSLNIGISLSRFEYIARHDADDTCSPSRLEKQLEFLSNNAEIGVLGTNYQTKKENGVLKKNRLSSREISVQLMYKNPICHPSVVFRKDLFLAIGGYNESFVRSQDFELWLRMLPVTKMHILPDVLVTRCEFRGVSMSTTEAAYAQWFNGVRLRINYIWKHRRLSLIAFVVVGAAYHLFRLLINALTRK